MKTSDTRSPSANLSHKDRAALFLEYEGNKRFRNLGTVLYRLTGGRFTLVTATGTSYSSPPAVGSRGGSIPSSFRPSKKDRT
jgi:hypothetical protein